MVNKHTGTSNNQNMTPAFTHHNSKNEKVRQKSTLDKNIEQARCSFTAIGREVINWYNHFGKLFANIY